jgi:uncharacterized membrane-anchored protein YhcB (DUF1043 family)
MDQWVQWVVTTIIAVVAIFVGRIWEKYDRRSKKDRELIDKILLIVPIGSDTYRFLKEHDFGGMFRQNNLRPLHDLRILLGQPSIFFLNKRLNKLKTELYQSVAGFLELVVEKMFTHSVQLDYLSLVDTHEAFRLRVGFLRQEGMLPSETELEQLRKEIGDDFVKTRKQLNEMAGNICDKYDNLVMSATRIL